MYALAVLHPLAFSARFREQIVLIHYTEYPLMLLFHIHVLFAILNSLDNALFHFCLPYKKPPAVDISILLQEVFYLA